MNPNARMGKTSVGLTVGLAVAALAVGRAQAVTVLVNGSFEQHSLPAWPSPPWDSHSCETAGPMTGYIAGPEQFARLTGGSAYVTGWTVTGSVDYIQDYWHAAEGRYSFDLGGGAPGAIAQTFNTQPNSRYLVQFSLAGNPANKSIDPDKVLIVEVSVFPSSVTQMFAFDTTDTDLVDMGWVTRSFQFDSYGSEEATISFSSFFADGEYAAAIDNVSVTRVLLAPPPVVPEPATAATAALALLATARLVVTRRKPHAAHP